MKRSLLGSTLILALLLSLAEGAFQPAGASDWYIGGGFRVGGVHFSLAYDRAHRGHRSSHYYRTRGHVRYDGYRCGRYCFKRSGYNYHHSSCPLVLHHFRRHDYHPGRAYGHFRSPYSYGYRGEGYYSHREYDRGRSHPDYDRGRSHPDYGHRDSYREHGYDRHRTHNPKYCPYR